jgi:hypothetical protein
VEEWLQFFPYLTAAASAILGEEKEQLIAVKYGFLKIATTVNILNSPGLLLSN